MTNEEAQKLLMELSQVDEGNETVMTDIFSKFVDIYPEHLSLVDRIYQQQNAGKPFRKARG